MPRRKKVGRPTKYGEATTLIGIRLPKAVVDGVSQYQQILDKESPVPPSRTDTIVVLLKTALAEKGIKISKRSK